jgi:hypothetical protein
MTNHIGKLAADIVRTLSLQRGGAVVEILPNRIFAERKRAESVHIAPGESGEVPEQLSAVPAIVPGEVETADSVKLFTSLK